MDNSNDTGQHIEYRRIKKEYCQKLIKCRNRARYMLFAVFALYLIVLVSLLFLRTPYDASVSYRSLMLLKPFGTILNQLRFARYSNSGALVRYGMMNLAGNFMLFLPMGFLLPCVFKKLRKFFLTISIIMTSVVLVETLQLITRRGFADIDDLILNTLGAAIGYFIFYLIRYNSGMT